MLAATWRSDAGRDPCAAASWELPSFGALGTGVTGHSCSYVPSLPESLSLKKVTALIDLVLRRHHVCHFPGVKK